MCLIPFTKRHCASTSNMLLRVLTNIFRVLTLFALLIILMINAAVTVKVSPTVSAWLVFSVCIFAELAMLLQTLKNREENTCREIFGMKLLTVCLLFLTSVTLLIVNLL